MRVVPPNVRIGVVNGTIMAMNGMDMDMLDV